MEHLTQSQPHVLSDRTRGAISTLLVAALVLAPLCGCIFSPREPGIFVPIWEHLLRWGDAYFVLADLPSYGRAFSAAAEDFTDRVGWARKAILNVARIGKFSSDRTIREYARDIWGVRRV